MSQNRSERDHDPIPSTPVMMEMLRQGAEAGKDAVSADRKEGRIALFWKVCGGTLLSIGAMICVTAYQQFNNSINDLRNDLTHLNTDLRKDLGRLSETHGDLVKKDEFGTRMRSVWDGIGTLRQSRDELATLKERCSVLLDLYKAGEEERRQLTQEIQRLREHQAGEQQKKELVQELQRLRERLAGLEARQPGAATTHRATDH
jgi:DNA repair exonuclease SbcCD ATPase subunit